MGKAGAKSVTYLWGVARHGEHLHARAGAKSVTYPSCVMRNRYSAKHPSCGSSIACSSYGLRGLKLPPCLMRDLPNLDSSESRRMNAISRGSTYSLTLARSCVPKDERGDYQRPSSEAIISGQHQRPSSEAISRGHQQRPSHLREDDERGEQCRQLRHAERVEAAMRPLDILGRIVKVARVVAVLSHPGQ